LIEYGRDYNLKGVLLHLNQMLCRCTSSVQACANQQLSYCPRASPYAWPGMFSRMVMQEFAQAVNRIFLMVNDVLQLVEFVVDFFTLGLDIKDFFPRLLSCAPRIFSCTTILYLMDAWLGTTFIHVQHRKQADAEQ